MSQNPKWQYDLEEYIRQGEADRAEKNTYRLYRIISKCKTTIFKVQKLHFGGLIIK